MKAKRDLQRGGLILLALVLIVGIGGWVLLHGRIAAGEWAAVSQTAWRRPTGQPQMLSAQPLPAMDGEMCEWEPASATMSLAATLQQPPEGGLGLSAAQLA